MGSSSRPPRLTTGGSSRFSSTESDAKMPRSSGHSAMPARAISFEAQPMSSRPANRTDPARWPTMPMIDLSVVVLPAPLRPSSVTTSPANTSKLAPCSTWDSPYQACSPSIASNGAALGLSMTDPEIGLAHRGIGRDRRVVPLGQHPAARQHGNAMGEVGDDAEIVLDHQHRALGSHRLDEGADAIDVLVTHARHRLVEQEHFRLKRQRGGDLERAFATIRQFHRRPTSERGETNVGDQRHRPLVESLEHALRTPKVARCAALSLQRDANVL